MNEKIEETITTTEVIEPLPPLFPNSQQLGNYQFGNNPPRPLPPSPIKTPLKPILKSNEGAGGDEYKKSISSKSSGFQ